MAFSSNNSGGPMADINVTPLVDVMLVLLIIFMITAPMLTHKISIDLPQPTKDIKPPTNPVEPIKLKITESGGLYMNNVPVTESDLKLQLQVYAAKPIDKQPELQIQAADNVDYQVVASVLADAKTVGMKKIGFMNIDR